MLLNNKGIQTYIISDYLSKQLVFNDSEILINDFDYNIFDQQINSDLFVIKNHQNYTDTLFSFSDILITVNVVDVLFSNHLNIDHLYIDSVKIHMIESNEEYPNNVTSILAKLSSLNKEITISNLTLNDLTIKHKEHILKSIRLSTDKFRINQDYLDIVDIKLVQDGSLINANCQVSHNLIKIDIQDSYLQNVDSLLYKSNIPISLSDYKIDFSSLISINKDSINCSSFINYGESNLNLNFVKNKNALFLNYTSTLQLRDFSSIPSYYYNVDSVRLVGNVEFGATDFVFHKGVIDSYYGSLNFDANRFKGEEMNVVCDFIDFDLGFLLDQNGLGKMNAVLSFQTKNNKLFNFNSNISSLFFNGYNYQDISIKENALFESGLSYNININDPNVNLLAQCNIYPRNDGDYFTYQSNLSGSIQNIDLNDLNYHISDSVLFVSTDFFIDNIDLVKYVDKVPFLQLNNPYLQLKNLIYNQHESTNSIGFINFNFDQNMSYVYMDSDIGVGECKTFNHKILDLFTKKKDISFELSLDLNKASSLSDLLFNNIDFNDKLICSISSLNDNLPLFNLITPSMTIFKTHFLDIDFKTDKNIKPVIDCKIDKILFSDNISIDNFIASTVLENEKEALFSISYFSKNTYQSALKGNLLFSKNYIDVDFHKESAIYFSSQYWRVDPESKMTFNNNKITFKNLSLNSGGQTLNLNGWFNKEPYFAFSFNNFQLNYLNPFLNKEELFFDGIVDGDVFFNTSSFPIVSGNFEVDEFSLNKIPLGKLILNNSSNENNDSIYTTGLIENIKNTMDFLVKYPLDGTKNIHANIKLNQFPADVIDIFIKPISDLKGHLNGDILIQGPIDNYHIFGQTQLNQINFNIPYLGTEYSANNNSMFVNFDQDRIIIDDFNFYDNLHSTSGTFHGEITHSAMKDMSYDLVINSDSLYALNTSENDNENYYGNIFLKGEMFIEGVPQKIKLDIDGQSKEGSSIMIPLLGTKEIQENKFIQFVNDDVKQLDILHSSIKKPEFNMDFNLSIDNQSEIQLIFDEELGDLIRGYGEGDLLLQINKEGDFEIFGDFEIDKGNYLFTLQDVITKSFEIERGGVINFNGSLENARINLNVLYNVQASLHPLNPDYDRNQKSPIVCRMDMFGPLLNPDINFNIDILNGDQIAETSLESITNTDQKLLEQFLYLLIANSFLIENDPTIDYLGNTLATTGTELLSNQLSNWLSQTTDAFDLGFKWVPGTSDSLSYQQIELAVSKKFLDNRVIVNGNVGTPPEQSEANIVGDVDIEYDFFKDGRFKLRVFNRTEEYDPLSESLGYEQGVGVFFKKQFNNFPELFNYRKK